MVSVVWDTGRATNRVLNRHPSWRRLGLHRNIAHLQGQFKWLMPPHYGLGLSICLCICVNSSCSADGIFSVVSLFSLLFSLLWISPHRPYSISSTSSVSERSPSLQCSRLVFLHTFSFGQSDQNRNRKSSHHHNPNSDIIWQKTTNFFDD